MAEIQTSGGGRKANLELNLVPFIDLMSVLITFLLITAVWSQVSMIQIGSSIYGKNTGNSSEQPPPPDTDVVLKIEIRANGYTLTVGKKSYGIPLKNNDYDDRKEYQTVFAKPEGSKAAPTAGLHFTPRLLDEISKNHNIAEITLHVGLGTFSPLTDEQLSKGKLHSEWYEITASNIKIINNAKHITAVGTTSARTLESVPNYKSNRVDGWTDILITPGYKYKKVNL